MTVRKSVRNITTAERDAFIGAILKLKATPAVVTGMPTLTGVSMYDLFVALHQSVLNVLNPLEGTLPNDAANVGHFGPLFLSWHRQFLHHFELALRAASGNPSVFVPYWDWTDPVATGLVFADDFLGRQVVAGDVTSGWFAYTASTTSLDSSVWPKDAQSTPLIPGWRIHPDLDLVCPTPGGGSGSTTPALERNAYDINTLPAVATMARLLSAPDFLDFRRYLEQGDLDALGISGEATHNAVHNWVGGHMGVPAGCGLSPNDPSFWVVHANVDRLWSQWQTDAHMGTSFFFRDTSGAFPDQLFHDGTALIWPWDNGFASAVPANNVASRMSRAFLANLNTLVAGAGMIDPHLDILAVPTTTMTRTSNQVVDHRRFGYCYDSEVVIALVLDQSGSMGGAISPTNPTVKWAQLGTAVQNFLFDLGRLNDPVTTSAAAVAWLGALTFHTDGTLFFLDDPAPLFSSLTYTPKVIKLGDDAALAGQLAALTPNGGTPIAMALQAAHTNILDTALSTIGPWVDGEIRYLSLLTDGMETSGSTRLGDLPPNTFNRTRIFTLGFGDPASGSADQATLESIAQKGTSTTSESWSTSDTNVSINGNDAMVMNEYYLRVLTAAMNYVPLVDPKYVLNPADYVDTFFQTLSCDAPLFMVIQGYDYRSENWRVEVQGPDGTVYSRAAAAPLSITWSTSNGRTVIQVFPGSAPRKAWVGQWRIRVWYRSTRGKGTQVMGSTWLVPAGAPEYRHPQYTKDAKAIRQLQGFVAGGDLYDPTAFSMQGHVHGVAAASHDHPSLVSGASPDVMGTSHDHGTTHDHGTPAPAPTLPSTHLSSSIDWSTLDPSFLHPSVLHDHAPWPRPGAATVTVDVYARSQVRVEASVHPSLEFPEFHLKVEVKDLHRPGIVKDLTGAARVFRPSATPGDLFADLSNVSRVERQMFTTQTDQGILFDSGKFLAEAERRKPTSLAIRDEMLHFGSFPGGEMGAKVSSHVVPGRVVAGIQVNGLWKNFEGEWERFSRVVEASGVVPLVPDASVSAPELHWLGPDRFAVVVVPKDASGHAPTPAEMGTITVKVDGTRLKAETVHRYDGTVWMFVTAEEDCSCCSSLGALAKKPSPSRHGGHDHGTPAVAPQPVAPAHDHGAHDHGEQDHTTSPLQEQSHDHGQHEQASSITVEMMGVSLPVFLPGWIGDCSCGRAYPSGTAQAFAVSLEDRMAFRTAEDALASKFVIDGTSHP